MEQHKCSRCDRAATHVIVSGCLAEMHVQTKFYCRKHWDQIHQNAADDGRTRITITCMACHTGGTRFAKADDYIEAEL